MIYEYALDPALVATWHDRREYLFFEEKFGIATRRIVSIYPKKSKWNKMIWDAFQSGDCAEDENAKIRLSALLMRLSEEAVKRRNTFNEIPSWLDRTEREHNERPFRAILTNIAGRTHPAVIETRNLIRNGHDLWNVPGLATVPRRASEMAALVAPVLRFCRHAIFVDPYFDPNKTRFRQPFLNMIEKIYEYRDTLEDVKVELHTGIERFFKSRYSPPRTEENERKKFLEILKICQMMLPGIVRRGAKLRLVIWKKRPNGQELHNRLILTETFGILFPTGLDESPDPDSESMDNVIPLPKEQLIDCWKHYEKTSPAFDYAGDPVEIIGEKT
jgi:hypothetical protein